MKGDREYLSKGKKKERGKKVKANNEISRIKAAKKDFYSHKKKLKVDFGCERRICGGRKSKTMAEKLIHCKAREGKYLF